MKNLDNILEGLLFISGDGLEKGYIMEKLSVTDKELDKAIENLKEKYSKASGIQLLTYKDKVQLCSNPDYADDISVVLNPIREKNLSKSTLEVIAIVCYKQPITRLEIEEIRGVNSDYAIQTLLTHRLIEVIGRKDTIGKPLLFGTTDEFLKRFQIENLSQLPDYEDILKQVETIEDDKSLYKQFEIKDDENQVVDGIYVNGKNKGRTVEQVEEENRKERQEQMQKDDSLLENLVNTSKVLDEQNKVIKNILNPATSEEQVDGNLVANNDDKSMEKENTEISLSESKQEQNEKDNVEVVEKKVKTESLFSMQKNIKTDNLQKVKKEENGELTLDEIDMMLKEEENDIPNFLKKEKNIQKVE